MTIKEYIEELYINSLIVLVRILSNLGGYRVALKLYPFDSSFFSGVKVKRKYLNKNYGLSIQLNSKDLIDHKILFTGVYEKDTNRILTEYIKEGDLVIEAGAKFDGKSNMGDVREVSSPTISTKSKDENKTGSG